MKTFYIESLGCPKNLVDSERFTEIALRYGYKLTTDVQQADMILINTCGFILDAKRESIDTILEYNEIRKPNSYLAVTGCLVKRYLDALESDIPEVNSWIDLKDFYTFESIFTDQTGQNHRDRHLLTPSHYAYLRIGDGCNNNCAYCAIPSIRGKLLSDEMPVLVEEARALARSGVKELIITAQDITQYGIDRYGESRLPQLLWELEDIPGIEWIRLMYLHPAHITEKLLTTIASIPKICRYLDIPIQHISDPILKAMNRHSSAEQIEMLIRRIRTILPDIAIRTTFITGFPGETVSDFRKLETFIREMKFDRLGVFTYSEEEGTAAYEIMPKVATKTAENRKDKLMQIQQQISRELLEEKVGKRIEVIIDGDSKDEGFLYEARTRQDAPEIDGIVYITSGKARPGDIVTVEVIDSWEYDLVGVIV